ncbi:MAG: N-glycosylase/DNA lyase [Brevinematales bacterium]
MKESFNNLYAIYLEIKDRVGERLREFERIREKGSEEELFEELVFCLLTPQSRAMQAEKAVRILKDEHLLYRGGIPALSEKLNIVRFRNNKARFICEAREIFCSGPAGSKPRMRELLSNFTGSIEIRDWLTENIMGIGYKEASHFVRNTGYFTDAEILDRHVIRNLLYLGVLEEDVKSLARKNYLEIEKRMKEFSSEIGIPMDYLDFVMMYRDIGDIFK